MCPCRLNDKTEQVDPTCDACGNDGWQYILPRLPVDTPALYADVAPPFVDTSYGKATQAIITQVTNDPQVFEQFGEWVMGACRLSTFSFNRVAYRDRFQMVDSTMIYEQVLPMPASGIFVVGRKTREQLRYRVVEIHNIIEVTSGGVVVDHADNATVDAAAGSVQVGGSSPPAEDTLVTIVYEFHPIWVVMERTHAVRDTLVAFKTTKALGDVKALPQSVFARLDFLVGPDSLVTDA